MNMVWMKHPQLPDTQLIYEPEDAAIGHQMSGWLITAAPDPPPVETPPEGLERGPDGEETEDTESTSRSSRRPGRRGTIDEGKE